MSISVLLFNTNPIFATAVAIIFMGEFLTVLRAILMFSAFLGVILINIGSSKSQSANIEYPFILFGLLASLIGGISLGIGHNII